MFQAVFFALGAEQFYINFKITSIEDMDTVCKYIWLIGRMIGFGKNLNQFQTLRESLSNNSRVVK